MTKGRFKELGLTPLSAVVGLGGFAPELVPFGHAVAHGVCAPARRSARKREDRIRPRAANPVTSRYSRTTRAQPR